MDSWSRGRGRARGSSNRGRGGNNNGGFRGRQNDDSFDAQFSNSFDRNDQRAHQSSSGGSIFSRLGPTNNAPRDDFDRSFGSNRNSPNRGRQQDSFQSRGGGGGFRSDAMQQQQNPRGGFRSDSSFRGSTRQNQPFQSRGGQRGRGREGRQYTRDFMDEDIEMSQGIPPGATVVTVTGHPPNTEYNLLGFLRKKAKHPWEPLGVEWDQHNLYIGVESPEIAKVICRMNGFNFSQSTLTITTEGNYGPGSGGQRQRGRRSNVLEEFLQERWDEQSGFLNLDDLPQTSHSIATVISRLLSIAKNIFGNRLVTVSFARNGLWSVKPLMKLADLFPGLQNLSVQENDISEFRSLDALAGKLPQLCELLLSGNPIQLNHDWQHYQREVTQRFPSIKLLDQQPIATGSSTIPSGQIGFSVPMIRVPQVKGSFFDNDNSRQATQELLSKYFPLFDSNRAALLDLYDPQAVLSIAVSRSSFAQNIWGQVMPGQRVTVGNENIIKRLTGLPPTMHNMTRPEIYVTDAWQTTGSQSHPVILFLTVRGEFSEATGAKGAQYSFDRVFIVAPSQSGSRAQAAGWQFVILSDSLVLRNYAGHQAFQPGAQ